MPEIMMKPNRAMHAQPQRKSIRLKNYDYSQPGYYFITICTQNRECLFGHILNGDMVLNDMGQVVQQYWNNIPSHFSHVQLDAFITMPNHIHGILIIAKGRGTACRARNNDGTQSYTACHTPTEQFGKPAPGSIPTIVRSLKSAITKRINEIQKTPGNKLWQRNYWEHIVRNDNELNGLRQYIINNPENWQNDKLNGGSGNNVGGIT